MNSSRKSTPPRTDLINKSSLTGDDDSTDPRPTEVTKFQKLSKERIEACMDDSFMKQFGIERTENTDKIEYTLRDCHLSTKKKVNEILTQFYIDVKKEMLSFDKSIKPLE